MSADRNKWWERFFDTGNRLSWSTLQNPTDPWAAHVRPWIEIAQDAGTDLPIILPRLDTDGHPSWYCGGRSIRATLRLREALQAFIGPSYSDFDGRPCKLDAGDPVEAAFAEGTIAPAYRIRASKPDDVPRIRRALELYRGLLGRMPKLEQKTRRPLGTLRAELDRAVAVGDEAEARRLLERIRSIGRLDAENLLYLEIGVRAGLGQWRELAEDGPLLNQLVGLRLPAFVLADVHDALYRLYVEPSEDPKAPNQALDAFRGAGLPRRTTLFSSRRGLRSARVLKAFFLYELAREDADPAALTALSSELETLNDAFAHALLSLVPTTGPRTLTDPTSAADKAFDNLETERALELYLRASPSRKRLSRLILCAEDVGTKDAAKLVCDAIESGDEADKLPESWSQRLQALERMNSPKENEETPTGWLDWARRVELGMSQDDAMNVARENKATWETADLLQSNANASELTSIISNASDSADALFREASLLLYQSLFPESATPPRQLKPLLQVLITKIAFLTDPSQAELELARDMTSTLLVMGLNAKDYASLIDDLKELMGSQLSIFSLPWALDLAELLAIHACPAQEERLRFASHVLDQATRLTHRLSTTDALVLEQLCQDYAIDVPSEIAKEDLPQDGNAGEELTGKRIAIYTLVEQAGQRAATLLSQICPTVRVDLNSDHECTKQLINLARTADLFVFAWKSSKHQAFYCVKNHRDSSNPMIQAKGKGTSSILRAVLARD